MARTYEELTFMWKKYYMSERSKRVKYFFHGKIYFISSNQRVIFFLLHTDMSVSKITLILQCPKQRNDICDIFTSEDMENMSLASRM